MTTDNYVELRLSPEQAAMVTFALQHTHRYADGLDRDDRAQLEALVARLGAKTW